MLLLSSKPFPFLRYNSQVADSIKNDGLKKLHITTCIFDFDGVLVDSEIYLVKLWEKAARELGFDFHPQDFYIGLGSSLDDYEQILCQRFGVDFPFEVVLVKVQQYFRELILSEGLPQVDGVGDIQHFLEENHIKMAVASSTYRDEVLFRMQLAGLKDLFTVVLGGDDIEHAKPAPDIFIKAAQLLGSKPEDCLVLEDSENGVLAAKNAGMRVFVVKNLCPITTSIQQKADAIFSSHHELLAYLRTNRSTLF